MAKTQRGSMDARISVTDKTRNALSNFIQGAGVKYDDLLRYLMEDFGLDIDADENDQVAFGLKYRGVIPNYDEQRKKEAIAEKESNKQKGDK